MANRTAMTDGHNLVIPEATPILGVKYERIDYVADHRTPQGSLQLGRICIVARSGNAAENIVLPVLYSKSTGNRFASFGQTSQGEYRRNIQGLTADTVEEYQALQSLAQGYVRAAVRLFFRPIEVVVAAVAEVTAEAEAGADAAAATA